MSEAIRPMVRDIAHACFGAGVVEAGYQDVGATLIFFAIGAVLMFFCIISSK